MSVQTLGNLFFPLDRFKKTTISITLVLLLISIYLYVCFRSREREKAKRLNIEQKDNYYILVLKMCY